MSKKPLVNSLIATVYIVLLVLGMNYGVKLTQQQDSLLMPIGMISLFTLSAAIMGYLFCFQPIQMYLDGKKKQAVTMFLQTVGIFGITTVVILVLIFSGLIR